MSVFEINVILGVLVVVIFCIRKVMAQVSELTDAVTALTAQVARVEALLANAIQPVDLDPVLAGINDATARLAAI